jgi:hypothetical protein
LLADRASGGRLAGGSGRREPKRWRIEPERPVRFAIDCGQAGP